MEIINSIQQSRSWGKVEEGQSGEGGGDSRRSSVESIDDVHKTSSRLLLSLANDYSLYIKTDLSEQISKVEEFLQEGVAKIEEFQSLFEMKESERKAWISVIVPDLVRTGTLLIVALNQRLETLASLILSIQSALDRLDSQIGLTEARLGLPSPSISTATSTTSTIKSVFKYFIKTDEFSGNESSSLSSIKKPDPPSLEQLNSTDPLQLVNFFH